jgi:hypothetical protein
VSRVHHESILYDADSRSGTFSVGDSRIIDEDLKQRLNGRNGQI